MYYSMILLGSMILKKYITPVCLSGIVLLLHLEFEEAEAYFRPYGAVCEAPIAELSVKEADWLSMQKKGLPRCGQIEISIMTALASDVLLTYNRMILHAAAFSFQERAWLIAGAPQVGKSTQVRYLMDLYPDKFSVICGDRPILQLPENGNIIVHPSPWNGKENWHGAPAVPLEGILCLKRSETTHIRRLKPREAVLPVFSALISTRDSEGSIRKLAEMETALLESVPVYEYHNGGVPDSTRILYRFLEEGGNSSDL